MLRRRLHLFHVLVLDLPDTPALLLPQLVKTVVSLGLLVQTHLHFLLTKRIVGVLDRLQPALGLLHGVTYT